VNDQLHVLAALPPRKERPVGPRSRLDSMTKKLQTEWFHKRRGFLYELNYSGSGQLQALSAFTPWDRPPLCEYRWLTESLRVPLEETLQACIMSCPDTFRAQNCQMNPASLTVWFLLQADQYPQTQRVGGGGVCSNLK
jgi:hypothetical protein